MVIMMVWVPRQRGRSGDGEAEVLPLHDDRPATYPAAVEAYLTAVGSPPLTSRRIYSLSHRRCVVDDGTSKLDLVHKQGSQVI